MAKTKAADDNLRGVVSSIHQAGSILLDRQAESGWKLKDDGTFLTESDLEVQQYLEPRLRASFPNHEFIGEETAPPGIVSSDTGMIILDPIDGTAAFARGLKFYAISLAVLNARRQPSLSILHFPALERWHVVSFGKEGYTNYRVSHQGASVQFAEIEPCPIPPPPFGPSCYLYVSSDAFRSLDLSRFEGKVRGLGATAAHLALLLDGTIDPLAVALTRYKIWDVMAGLSIAVALGFEVRSLEPPHQVLRLDELLVDIGVACPPLLVTHPSVVTNILKQVRITTSQEGA